MKILLLDNYDSFTYNLFHLLDQFDGVDTEVIRNDHIGIDEVKVFDRIVISPGPGIPKEAGITIELIQKYFSSKPILGVCLGMQSMAVAFGGRIRNLPEVMHGISTTTTVTDANEKLFKNIPVEFQTGHYHSWCVDEKSLPKVFHVTSKNKNGVIMSMTHENKLMRGVQFHPESILTEFGKELMSNWLFKC